MNTSQPVISSIRGAAFGFLGSDDIKALSVQRVTNSTTFDLLLNPNPGGLYDPAYGAFDETACSTCGLKAGCPGHCGHIELPVRVYHPTFMPQVLRLLRAKCVYCHKLKLHRTHIRRYICKLNLIQAGLIDECHQIDDIKAERQDPQLDHSSADEQDAVDSGGAIAEKWRKFTVKAMNDAQKRGTWSSEKLEAVVAERREIVRAFLFDLGKVKKCAACQGISPTYRKDRFTKIFKRPLGERDKNVMIQSGLKEQDPLVLLKRQRRAEVAAKNKALAQDEGVADLEDSPIESEGEGDDIEMLDIEEEVAGGTTLEAASETKGSKKDSKSRDADTFLNAGQVHAALVQLFEEEGEVLQLLYNFNYRRKKADRVNADMFFIKDLLVPPNKYRPQSRTGNDQITESTDNSLYKNVLTTCDEMGQIQKEINGAEVSEGRRRRSYVDFQNAWINLQDGVNSLIDRDRNPLQGAAARRAEEGIKQRLEKKEGLFRKNMMGKRVNFAARTVISPDPNIETNEIGVPPVFAVKLTYPEPVTDHNFPELKEAVMNGASVWPGAVAIENENGQIINLAMKNTEDRLALANQLQAPSSTDLSGARPKKVHRHLNNGDIVIMNRQPTLHKPSMMCHRARVLPGEKTLRMHYANCNSYNADFDGDEMNMHFPQNELARSEAINVADTDHQYLSATAGKPLRGLIQDHISMSVLLTNRDAFFTRDQYQQLIYAAIRPESNHTSSGRIETIPPAIFKPRPLWTGKQVISTVMKNVTPVDLPGLTLNSSSKISASNWGTKSEEAEVIFQGGELLCGILDKDQIGPSGGGLINSVYEAFGHTVAGKLLSILGRLLTKLLHMKAFSCGVEDLIFTGAGDETRKKALKKADTVGDEVAAKYVSLQADAIYTNAKELHRRLEDVLRDTDKQKGLDAVFQRATVDITSQVTRACLPTSLVKPFPQNQMQAMTISGAKGSAVNANQISCNLGQQSLEGNRVPVMVSGKTLPCFRPYDISVRAGGYIVDRFLTGVRPQEYYFHAMAGREGLIDTAVKTSRSGYLQRCLVKGLEGLRVEHDTSVRNADGSMVQFLYGEDGLEIAKAKYTSEFKFIGQNYHSFAHDLNVRAEWARIRNEEAVEHLKKAESKFRKTANLSCMDPTLTLYPPASNVGSMSEMMHRKSREYMSENPDNIIYNKDKTKGEIGKKSMQSILEMRYAKSVVEAGEAVGVIAGQSVGEPSTQMTLNTFHLAGHAAKNVTLGIPRLREIVMTASMKIPTPTMTLYAHEELPEDEVKSFAKSLDRVSLGELVDEAQVTERVGRGIAYADAKLYTVDLQFYPIAEWWEEHQLKVWKVLPCIEKVFLPRLQKSIRAELKKADNMKLLKGRESLPDISKSVGTVEQERPVRSAEAEGGDDDSDGEGDDDATKDKARNNKNQSGYEAPDEDEEEIAEQNRREASPEETEDETYGGSPPPQQPKTNGTAADEEGSSGSDSGSDSRPARGQQDGAIAQIESRIKSSATSQDVSHFTYTFNDTTSTCTFTMEYPAETTKLLFLSHLESALHSSLIQDVAGVKSVTYVREPADPRIPLKDKTVVTEGANLIAAREMQHMFNLNRLATNDIGAMLTLYGVEACRSAIVKELKAVFGGHAISVDYRHLSLIADFMTRHGGYTAFSRGGFAADPSPFMKMSFETTVGFLKDAVLDGDRDELLHPSARGVVGRVARMGTGSFDVLVPVRPWGSGERKEEVRVEAREEDGEVDEVMVDGSVDQDDAAAGDVVRVEARADDGEVSDEEEGADQAGDEEAERKSPVKSLGTSPKRPSAKASKESPKKGAAIELSSDDEADATSSEEADDEESDVTKARLSGQADDDSDVGVDSEDELPNGHANGLVDDETEEAEDEESEEEEDESSEAEGSVEL